jgi:dihydroorotate dehydrogenase (fumarate)
MADTTTSFLALDLSSPIVLSSSSLTNTVSGVTKAAEAGAGAVVLKSLFEEQIEYDLQTEGAGYDYAMHPDAETYVRQMGMHLGPERYLELIADAKEKTGLPIIASVNCVTPKWWGNYGTQIAHAGADAIELNIAIMPRERDEAIDIENRYVKIVDKVRQQVEIPIAVKIGPYFTSLPNLAEDLRKAGASALVLFNRFYQLDIDIEDLALSPGYQFSTADEIYTSLRWISILSGVVGCQLVASTGVHTGADVIKQLLAGATAVQVCSTVYKNGYEQIRTMNTELVEWMDRKGFETIADFRGKLSQSVSEAPESYERFQYIKALTGLS